MHYFILAVSKNRAQLFEVNDDRILPRGVDGMPTSMDEAWSGMERQEQSNQFHSGGGSGTNAIFHGQGGAKDVEEQEENEYIHGLAKSLHKLLHEQHAPLVFAGVEEEYGMFKKFDQSGALLEEYVRGNPDQMQLEDLKAKAEPIAKEHMMKENGKFLEQYGALIGTGRTSTDLAEVTERAAAGKVDILLVPEGSGETHRGLMEEVRSHRGRIAVVADDSMPEKADIAAILRL